MIGERLTFAELNRISSTPLQEPGSYHTIEKQDGSTVVAKYCQAGATTDLDTDDATSILYGVAGYIMASASPYDDPYKNYKVTDDGANSLTTYISDTNTAAPEYVVGFVACATGLTALYWGWLITWGHMADVPCDTGTNKFNDAGTLATVVDHATLGNWLDEAASPLIDQVVGFSTSVHGTAVTDLFVTIGLRM